MDNVREKLSHCFSLVFPQLDPSQFVTANADNVSAWDSLAHVTLLTLIGEEFGIDIDFEDMESATSFEALERALQLK